MTFEGSRFDTGVGTSANLRSDSCASSLPLLSLSLTACTHVFMWHILQLYSCRTTHIHSAPKYRRNSGWICTPGEPLVCSSAAWQDRRYTMGESLGGDVVGQALGRTNLLGFIGAPQGLSVSRGLRILARHKDLGWARGA